MIFRRRTPESPAPTPAVEPAPLHESGIPWEPGIPLYERGAQGSGDSYRLQIYTFRDDSDMEDDCHCGDAADWPQQKHRALPEGDEIGDLIATVRADREAAREQLDQRLGDSREGWLARGDVATND